MKNLVIAFLVIAAPVQAHPSEELDYPTSFLAQWVYQCANTMQPFWTARGLHPQLAWARAANDCSCVVDHFRRDHSYQSVINLSPEDRAEYGRGYAEECSTEQPIGV